MTRSTPGAALCKPRRTIGPLGQWEPEGVAEQPVHVEWSTHFLRVLSCRVLHVPGIGCTCSRRSNEHRHRNELDWSFAGRIRTATIGQWQTRIVDGGA